MIVHYDCRYFLGTKPCLYRRVCEGCPHYSPFGQRILIIKFAAMGDVLRTTPLLRGLRRNCPGSHITWLTEGNVVPLLEGVPEVDRLLTLTPESRLQLEVERFDIMYCFDKEPKATALAMKVKADKKIGFGMNPFGGAMPLNPESEYTFELGINDHLKFRVNRKTYPELIHDCAGLPYAAPEEYLLSDFSAEKRQANERLARFGISSEQLKIGLNTGAGDVFATKKWTEQGYAGLSERLVEACNARILLLGGPREEERNRRIASQCRYPLIDTGTDNSIRDFAGIIANCDVVVTGDTLAMHIAIGLKVPVVVMFGPTCSQEIELYGRGAMVISDFECSPCYLGVCPKPRSCMEATSVETVFARVKALIGKIGKGTAAVMR
jgi:ADP-heptose:LPS heptosyltransferase